MNVSAPQRYPLWPHSELMASPAKGMLLTPLRDEETVALKEERKKKERNCSSEM